jgi:hypothetical protein
MNEEALAMFSLGSSCQNNKDVKLCFFISNDEARMNSSEPQIKEFLHIIAENNEQMRKSFFKNFALQVMMSGNEGLAFFVWGLIGDPTFSKLSEFEIARIRTSRELSWYYLFFFANLFFFAIMEIYRRIAIISCSIIKYAYADDEVSLIFAAKSTALSLTDKKIIITEIIKKNNKALLEEGTSMSILISKIDDNKITYSLISSLIKAIWPGKAQRSIEALRIFLFRNKKVDYK